MKDKKAFICLFLIIFFLHSNCSPDKPVKENEKFYGDGGDINIGNSSSASSAGLFSSDSSSLGSSSSSSSSLGINLILNYSFEDDINNWAVTSSGTLSTSAVEFQDGYKSVYFNTLTSSISGREICSNIFSIDGAKGILISGFFKTCQPVANTKAGFKLYFFTDLEGLNKASRDSQTQISSNLINTNTWEEKSYTVSDVDIPDDAIYCRLAIRAQYISGIGTATDKVYFDNITVTNQ